MVVVLINPSAHGGKALQGWERIEATLEQRLGALTPLVLNGGAEARESLGRLLSDGQTEFIAAGGDGTVNLLVGTLLEQAPPVVLPRLKVGALGLGSSNDFHKPFRDERRIGGVPCRIDFAATVRHDVGFLNFEDGGRLRTRRWFVNASIGITAEANSFFNAPDAMLRQLKRRSTSAAIVYAALHALLGHRNREMEIAIDDQAPFRTWVSNLGVVKNPHFAGTFSYGSPYEPASGHFFVHLCENMSRPRLLLTLRRASRVGFAGLPSTRSWRARRLVVRAEQAFAVEFDGEVVRTRFAAFYIQQGAVQLCT